MELKLIEDDLGAAPDLGPDLRSKTVQIHSVAIQHRRAIVANIDACQVQGGFSGIRMIGNISAVCQSATERAESALRNCGLEMSATRCIVSFSPADLRIEGNQFDLGVALLLARLQGSVSDEFRVGEKWVAFAELSLDGRLRPAKYLISAVIAAIEAGCTGVICAREQVRELETLKALIKQSSFHYLAFEHLSEVLTWYFSGISDSNLSKSDFNFEQNEIQNFDDMQLSETQELAAMAIAVGFHSAFFIGPPGSGKTMFAQRIPSLLPRLQGESHLRSLSVHSQLDGGLDPRILNGDPPFRAPHHSASGSAVLGNAKRPGELSLAGGGVLFLDEFPEFRRDVLEGLREPLENRRVVISRADYHLEDHLEFIFIAAANPCPCGWLRSSRKMCGCHGKKIVTYQNRMSGPIMDRLDLIIPFESSSEFVVTKTSRSAAMLKRSNESRDFAKARNRRLGFEFNCEIAPTTLAETLGWCDEKLRETSELLLKKLETRRSVAKALRLARTLADLELRTIVEKEHVTQAIRLSKARFWYKNSSNS